MPLTHVCVWDSTIGYKRVSVEEACLLYPCGVSARSGHFVCELCAQNVMLTAPGLNIQHFRHDPNAPNKECDERQTYFDPTYGRSIRNLASHIMPLRISVTNSIFSLQLGFFFPPDTKARCDKIIIKGISSQKYEYSFERIESVGTTYLPIGSIPSAKYRIEYINATPELKKYWSVQAQGVSLSGSFFDIRTGQMLQSGGKAYTGNTYYLLQSNPINIHQMDIEVTEIGRKLTSEYTGWFLYKIRVKRFSEYSAKFFLKYAIFLTEKPAQFYPIWPVYIQDPYFIYHNASEFYFYLCGEDAELKSYPSGAKSVRTHDGIIYQISTREREQLVSFGKSGALGFSYLIKQNLKRTVPVPKVIIYDSTGNELTDDIYSKLPKEKLISVLCPYDGRAVIEKDGKTTYIYPLAAEQNVTIDGLSFGMTIRLFQGCDCVRTLSFTRKSAETDLSALDIEWVRKLNVCKGPMIPVTHSTGAITTKLAGCPEVQKWLYKKIKLGEMPRSAYLLLQSILKKGELM